jgi:hypothetical protein
MSLSMTYISSSQTMGSGPTGLFSIDASGGALTLTLSDAKNDGDGVHFYLKRIDNSVGNTVTIATQSSQKIDGANTISLGPKAKYHLASINGNWWILNM